MSRSLRILLLLLVLAFVALSAWQERARLADWSGPAHWIAVYPINGEGTAGVQHYVERLEPGDFDAIERWFDRWAGRYNPGIERTVEFRLAPEVRDVPPRPPADGAFLATVWWSLHMRYWAWRNDTFDGPADARIFVAYYDPEQRKRVAHSLGLRKGGIGVVNGFGHPKFRGRNRVVIAHELMHILGATDKYDRATGRPIHPAGYADPDRDPLLPQRRAEIMGATIPLSPSERRMPTDLSATVVGPQTAREIGWTAS